MQSIIEKIYMFLCFVSVCPLTHSAMLRRMEPILGRVTGTRLPSGIMVSISKLVKGYPHVNLPLKYHTPIKFW